MLIVYLHTHMHTPVSNVSLITAVKPKYQSHGHLFSLLFSTEICSHVGHFCTEGSYIPLFLPSTTHVCTVATLILWMIGNISTKMQCHQCRDVDTEFLQNPPVGQKIITGRKQVSNVAISINTLHTDITKILSAQSHLNQAPKTQYFAFHFTGKICVLSFLIEEWFNCYRKRKECKTSLLPKMHSVLIGA